MKTSPAGKSFIKSNEGFDRVLRNDVGHPVIGYGHDLTPEEIASGVYAHGITEQQADDLLDSDTDKWDEAIDSLNWDLNQNQHDALSDFTHNDGIGALRQLAAHGMSQVPAQLPRWCHTRDKNGALVVSPGLLARRQKEVKLFITPE